MNRSEEAPLENLGLDEVSGRGREGETPDWDSTEDGCEPMLGGRSGYNTEK